ncbi:Hypothetical protein CINCED_3A007612 [Cinara cedri]|uniref:Uncharacterized protein n=1 Tax=Cinara cedri TaxID=506608 RepID=A0A5E4NMR6_9HEMI|nr:Hypothetical protein CINCED_3A007612 [Cinara cedri]
MVVDIPVVDGLQILKVNAGELDVDIEIVKMGFDDLVVDPQRDMPQVIVEEVVDVHGNVPVGFVDMPPLINYMSYIKLNNYLFFNGFKFVVKNYYFKFQFE